MALRVAARGANPTRDADSRDVELQHDGRRAHGRGAIAEKGCSDDENDEEEEDGSDPCAFVVGSDDDDAGFYSDEEIDFGGSERIVSEML